MKKTIKILILILIVIIIAGGIGVSIKYIKKVKNKNEIDKAYNEMKQNSLMYNNTATVDELKEEYGMSGNDDLYDVQTEYDGRQVLKVKATENFKVAFAGLANGTKNSIENSSEIFENEYPTENGIWIEKNSREKIEKYLNENMKSKYKINEKGYLTISEKKSSKEDNEIEKIINGNKQYIIGISGINYYIDALTGEAVDNPFEELDKYQTYAYCQDEDKMVIFITENKSKALENSEIFESVLALMK